MPLFEIGRYRFFRKMVNTTFQHVNSADFVDCSIFKKFNLIRNVKSTAITGCLISNPQKVEAYHR